MSLKLRMHAKYYLSIFNGKSHSRRQNYASDTKEYLYTSSIIFSQLKS